MLLLPHIQNFFTFWFPREPHSPYRTQVLPLLDYGCVLWDPHLSKHKQQLEKVQLFATRMASKQWNESAEKEFEEKMMTRYISNILKGEVVVSSGMNEGDH